MIGKTIVVASAFSEERKRIAELIMEEKNIMDELRGDIPLVGDQLDFGNYDNLNSRLREVRAELASLTGR